MSRKIRFYYHFFLAILKKEWKKFTFSFLALVILLGIGLFATPAVEGFFDRTSGKYIKLTFVEALVGNPSTFNPLFSTSESEREINNLVFRGLTKIDSAGVVRADLAASFKNISNTEYEFKLKNNIFWHDGQKFTADDVVYTFTTAQNSLYKSLLAATFKDVEVKKVDELTVRFKLKEPFAPFITTTNVGIIAKHIPLNNYTPIGTGDFKFVDIKSGSVTLEGKQIKIKFNFYPTQEAAETAIKLGESHALVGDSQTERDLTGWKNLKINKSVLSYRIVSLFFNTKTDFFSEKNKSLRQALAYCLEKEKLILGPSGAKGKVALNSLADLPDLQKNAKERYIFNIDKANSLLSSLGWQISDGKLLKDGKKLTFTITTLDDKDFTDTANKIKEQWGKLGIEVIVQPVSGSTLRDRVLPNRTFEVLLSPLLVTADPDQYVFWHTTQTSGANITSISSPKIDKLLEDGRKTIDPTTRSKIYQEFTRILLDEDPAIFLYYPNYTYLYSTRMSGVDLTSLHEPEDRFNSAGNWTLKNPLF